MPRPAGGRGADGGVPWARAARHEHVAGQRTPGVVAGLQPVGDRVADGREWLWLEQRFVGSLGRHGVVSERLVKEGVDHRMDARSQRAVDRVLDRQDVGASVDRLLAAGRLEEDATAPPIADLGLMRWSGPDHLDARFLDVFAQPIEEAKAEHGWRQCRNLENRVADLGRKARVDIAVVSQAQHRRHAEAMAVDTDLATDPARNLLPE